MSMDATLIDPAQLAAPQAAEPVVIIDTRDADTFAAGHIPGAVNLREVFTFLALKQAGFGDVRMYFGSWNEWSRDDSLPIETGLPVAKAHPTPAAALAA